jgi:hypothetical protein
MKKRVGTGCPGHGLALLFPATFRDCLRGKGHSVDFDIRSAASLAGLNLGKIFSTAS